MSFWIPIIAGGTIVIIGVPGGAATTTSIIQKHELY